MEDLEIVCPACGEASLVAAEDLETLEVGDVLECEACGAYLEVVSLDPLEVEAVEEGLEGFFVDCPRCGHTFEVSEEEEGEAVQCPECGFNFVPDWSEVEEEDEEW
ncbi:zf-TFIIB domain-containing protein [Thermus igniterrae]|jgi:lysine biosynthesis protein LysW|uniref:zf-TFIIB domain-containing protein n=1 Tax=Thermus igniterrae TaxID=88189 RepID=UPI000366DA50|nr:paraquat-inducible protein A [Thermus igniterrae]